MREKLKSIVLESPISWVCGVQASLKLSHETIHQMRRFRRNYAKRGSMRKAHLETQIIFFTHQIEKGLSHRDFRFGFGKGVLAQFAPLLAALRKVDAQYANNEIFQSAICALHEYRARHERESYDLAYMRCLFSDDLWNEIGKAQGHAGGVLTIKAADKTHNAELTYSQLAQTRHSVREFSDEPVSAEDIERAVATAMRTPSVCNCQPTRVHIITNAGLIAILMPLQGGFRGYKMPPALILLTADNQALMNQDERNEGYTDGGLFGMSLLLALEEQQLATCPLNTMLPMKRDEATRKLLNLPDSEFLVMYIAVGHFLPEVDTCMSKRFDAESIVTVHA